MTTTSRAHWWISLVLLIVNGTWAAVYLGRRDSLTVTARSRDQANVLRIAYSAPLSLDPHRRIFPFPACNHFTLSLWEPLVECDPATGQPLPAAAESWTWSADRKVLTLKLRADARWSNGDPVTAHDFVRAWLRLLSGPMDPAYTLYQLKNAEAFNRGSRNDPSAVGVRAVDDLTLQVEVAEPRVTLLAELADPLLVPLHRTSDKVFRDDDYQLHPSTLVTNGPFHLVGANADGFRLEASPSYHGRSGVRLAGVQFIRTQNQGTGILLIASGKADLLSPVNYSHEREPATKRNVEFDSELVLGVIASFFNVTRGPLKDVRVRRALALALDRRQMIRAADRDQLEPAWSWVPDVPGRKGLSLFVEDAAEARRLLAQAGYPDGKGFPILRMALPVWMKSSHYPIACCERWFNELGLKTYVVYEAPSALDARMSNGDYDLTYGEIIATVPDVADLLSTFTMAPEYNQTKWLDEKTIEVLAAANRKTGSERLALVDEAERMAMAAVPAVPLMFERRHVLRAAEVHGWYADPLARQSLKRIWLELGSSASSSPELSPRL